MTVAHIIFYEKPGCINNEKQKALLEAAGHTLEPRNLLTETWEARRLRSFFGDLPVADWFNPGAPDIVQGEVDPGKLSETEALAAMIADPLLIRRPLIETAGVRTVGFDLSRLPVTGIVSEQDLEQCPRKKRAPCDEDKQR